MKIRQPLDKQKAEFKQLIVKTHEKEVKKYLGKSYRAFVCCQLEAAVILAWCAVECYFRLAAKEIGDWYFEYHYERGLKKQLPSRWSVSKYIEVAKYTKIFEELETQIDEFSRLRNDVAHGNSIFLRTPTKLMDCLRSASIIYRRDKTQERLTIKTDDEWKYVEEMTLDIASDPSIKEAQFSKFMSLLPHDINWLRICHDLLDKFFKRNIVNTENIKLFIDHSKKEEASDEEFNVIVEHIGSQGKDYLERARQKEEQALDDDEFSYTEERRLLISVLPNINFETGPPEYNELVKLIFSEIQERVEFLIPFFDSEEGLSMDQQKEKSEIEINFQSLKRKIPSALESQWYDLIKKMEHAGWKLFLGKN